jgi:transcriptional regulator with XRE-family HTH domain
MTGLDIRVRRVRAELRQADVAAAAGLSRQRISALEHRKHLSPGAAKRLVDAIDRAARGWLAAPGELVEFPPTVEAEA